MANTVAASGTQTATVNTEHTLSTQTTAATMVLKVDTANMVNGDTLELRIKGTVLSGGTDRVVYYGIFQNVQAEPLKISVPYPITQNAVFTLKQTAGTSRDFPWAVEQLG